MVNWPGLLTTNWSVDTKYPGLYFLPNRMTSFSCTIACVLVPIGIFFERANNHEVHAGTGHFEDYFDLGEITGGKTNLFPLGSSKVCYFINSCMRYMLIPILQFHSSNYFWVSVIFWFFLDPTTCSSPRRTFFIHALSFECTSKLCIIFLNQFSVYFHI